MSLLSARRIVVHAQNARLGIELLQIAHDALRARPGIVDMVTAADGAGGEHFIFCAAIVAFEAVLFAVIGERDVAVLALGDIAAVAA